MAPNTATVALLSTDFMREREDPFTAHPSWNLWIKWIEYGRNATRLFVRITQGDTLFTCAVGDPANRDEEDDALFLPLWMIDTGRFSLSEELREVRHGEDEYTPRSHASNAQVTVLLTAEIPPATRIVLRPVETYLSNINIKNALQPVLTKLGVFQQGIQYEIPLEELGGLRVNFVVEELNPEPIALLEGDEVALEFTEAIEAIEGIEEIVEVSPPPIVAAAPTPSTIVGDWQSSQPMTPASPVPTPAGIMLPPNFMADWGVTPPITPPMPRPAPHRTAAELAELRTRRISALSRPAAL